MVIFHYYVSSPEGIPRPRSPKRALQRRTAEASVQKRIETLTAERERCDTEACHRFLDLERENEDHLVH